MRRHLGQRPVRVARVELMVQVGQYFAICVAGSQLRHQLRGRGGVAAGNGGARLRDQPPGPCRRDRGFLCGELFGSDAHVTERAQQVSRFVQLARAQLCLDAHPMPPHIGGAVPSRASSFCGSRASACVYSSSALSPRGVSSLRGREQFTSRKAFRSRHPHGCSRTPCRAAPLCRAALVEG